MKSRKHLADINLYTFLFSITILGKSASHFLEMIMFISQVGMLIQARIGVGIITGAREGSTYVFLMSKSINLYTFLLLVIILGNSASLSLEMIMLIS